MSSLRVQLPFLDILRAFVARYFTPLLGEDLFGRNRVIHEVPGVASLDCAQKMPLETKRTIERSITWWAGVVGLLESACIALANRIRVYYSKKR